MKQKRLKALAQSLVTVVSGLMINFPLQVLILYVCLNILELTSAFEISVVTSIVLTFTALIRCYIINLFFDK